MAASTRPSCEERTGPGDSSVKTREGYRKIRRVRKCLIASPQTQEYLSRHRTTTETFLGEWFVPSESLESSLTLGDPTRACTGTDFGRGDSTLDSLQPAKQPGD